MSLKSILAAQSMWARYNIELEFRNRVIGGIPNDPELIKGWIQANMPAKTEEERKKIEAATMSELPKLTEEKAEGMWTTFKGDDKGLYLEGRCAKAMFKESANILRDFLIKDEAEDRKSKKKDAEKNGKEAEKEGKSRFTALKAKLAERLYVEEDKLYLMRNGDFIKKPHGNEEKPIHIMTAQGPRTALKRFDYIEAPAQVKFTVRLLRDDIVDEDLVRVLLEHSAWNGLGADRSQGNGLFSVLKVEAAKQAEAHGAYKK